MYKNLDEDVPSASNHSNFEPTITAQEIGPPRWLWYRKYRRHCFARSYDGIDFLRLAPEIGIVTETTRYPLDHANRALADLRAGRFVGAAVLVP